MHIKQLDVMNSGCGDCEKYVSRRSFFISSRIPPYLSSTSEDLNPYWKYVKGKLSMKQPAKMQTNSSLTTHKRK